MNRDPTDNHTKRFPTADDLRKQPRAGSVRVLLIGLAGVAVVIVRWLQ